MTSFNFDRPIRLWPGLAPGETTELPGRLCEPNGSVARITDVTAPEIFVYGAAPGANKAMVMVFPGGGYEILASEHEGSEIAQWLNTIGFVSAVVHYRVPRNSEGAYQDARRAISWVRANAPALGIDISRVGVLGFSAGGHLVTRLAARGSERPYVPVDAVDRFDSRPDFAMPIYPAWLVNQATKLAPPEVEPNKLMPPLFLSQARDDGHFCIERYAELAASAGVDVACCAYEKGGHGYGMRLPADVAASRWTDDAAKWLYRFG